MRVGVCNIDGSVFPIGQTRGMGESRDDCDPVKGPWRTEGIDGVGFEGFARPALRDGRPIRDSEPIIFRVTENRQPVGGGHHPLWNGDLGLGSRTTVPGKSECACSRNGSDMTGHQWTAHHVDGVLGSIDRPEAIIFHIPTNRSGPEHPRTRQGGRIEPQDRVPRPLNTRTVPYPRLWRWFPDRAQLPPPIPERPPQMKDSDLMVCGIREIEGGWPSVSR